MTARQINHHVRPDSHVTLNAIRSIVSEEGFDDLLDSVRGRIDDIESLHRTREVMLKEPVRVRSPLPPFLPLLPSFSSFSVTDVQLLFLSRI